MGWNSLSEKSHRGTLSHTSCKSSFVAFGTLYLVFGMTNLVFGMMGWNSLSEKSHRGALSHTSCKSSHNAFSKVVQCDDRQSRSWMNGCMLACPLQWYLVFSLLYLRWHIWYLGSSPSWMNGCMVACPLQWYRTLSPRLSANIGRSDSYRLSGIILNCTTTVFLLFHFCISKDRSLWFVALIGLLWHPAVFLSLSLLVYLAVINARNVKFLWKFWYFPEYISRDRFWYEQWLHTFSQLTWTLSNLKLIAAFDFSKVSWLLWFFSLNLLLHFGK